MDMNELQRAWTSLDTRLSQQNLMLESLQRRHVLERLVQRLRPLGVALWLQLLVGLVVVLLAGSYWSERIEQPHLLFYGVAVHLYGIGLLATAIAQLTHITGLEPGLPVLDLQRRLLRLRRLRIAGERWLMAGGFFVWAPFVFLVLAASGLDVWQVRPLVVLSNLAIAVALSAGMLWASYRFRSWFERDASGRSLRQAESELSELLDGDAN